MIDGLILNRVEEDINEMLLNGERIYDYQIIAMLKVSPWYSPSIENLELYNILRGMIRKGIVKVTDVVDVNGTHVCLYRAILTL